MGGFAIAGPDAAAVIAEDGLPRFRTYEEVEGPIDDGQRGMDGVQCPRFQGSNTDSWLNTDSKECGDAAFTTKR
jgi:hypothetical protein